MRQRHSVPGAGWPGGDAVTSPRPRYTIEQYRADVAKLEAIRRSDAPGISEVLADALAADAELAAAVEEVPTQSVLRPRRPNLVEAALRAVGLARRSLRPPR
jgi:hypothetical protein